MSGTFLKFKRDPFGFLGRVLYKLLIAPLKYKAEGGYDANRYWRDRLAKYGMSLKGVGDEGLSEDENREMYQKAAHMFLLLCQQEKIDFTTVRVLEIGCGNGFYAQLLQDQGVKNYLGVDITDIFFSDFVERFPGFQFIRRDITADSITGKFDLILMIDVIEHIVGEEKLSIALNNIKTVIDDNGLFLLAPILEKGRCSLFNVRFWTTSDIKRRLLGFQFGELIQFRYSYLLPARKLSQVDLSSHIRD